MKMTSMSESTEELITSGSFVVVKKQNYKKLYKVQPNGSLMLGGDLVEMNEIIGKRFWTTFEMIPVKGKKKRTFSLIEVTKVESWNDLLSTIPSGNDNRSITDDGTAQLLSKEEILELQESGKTGKEIVGSLIENNRTFSDKTEYSQEKYIKKKEQKYFKYLTICKPTITSLHDVYFKLDHNKIGTLRMDALAQILSYSDVQSEGLYITYNSGNQGLPVAAMLDRIGRNTKGNLINLHPGNMFQTTIIQAMNFPREQLDRLINVNIYSFLRLHYQGESGVLNTFYASRNKCENLPEKLKESEKIITDTCVDSKETMDKEIVKDCSLNDPNEVNEKNDVTEESKNPLKRKVEDPTEDSTLKKPKWFMETHRAVDLVEKEKARGLVIVAKEHPLNIITALLPFLGMSRPFVIFHTHREPLQETYVALKRKQNVINVRLFSNFLRSYQVLPNRTHPDIVTSDTGGYLLTGYQVE